MGFPPPEQRKKYPSECSLCRGSIIEEKVTLPFVDRDGKLRVVRGVPAGVCQQCHTEKWLTFETSRAIDELLAAPPDRQETVSVWDYAQEG